MEKTKIAVFVSGGGTNLQALIDAEESRAIHSGEIKLVCSSNPDAYALKRAEYHGIDTYVIEDEDALLAKLDEQGIEMIVLAGFLTILSEKVIKKYPKRIINVHPSLIPSFCGKGFYGLKVHEKALEFGVKVTGATIHYVNEIPDDGEIIYQKAVDILDGDTPETLQKRVMEKCEWILLPKACEKVAHDIMISK